MERLVRLNEVQYAETEDQAARLMEQGFCVEAMSEEAPAKDNADGDKKGGK